MEIVLPKRPYFVLPADVPHGEGDVLYRRDRLNIEADCRNGGDRFVELELVEDGRFAGCVEAQHEDTRLVLSEPLKKPFQL